MASYSDRFNSKTLDNLTVTGNINGNVTGDVIGNLLGEVTGGLNGLHVQSGSFDVTIDQGPSGGFLYRRVTVNYNKDFKAGTKPAIFWNWSENSNFNPGVVDNLLGINGNTTGVVAFREENQYVSNEHLQMKGTFTRPSGVGSSTITVFWIAIGEAP